MPAVTNDEHGSEQLCEINNDAAFGARHYRRVLLAEDSDPRVHSVGVTQAAPFFGGRSNVH